MTKFPFRIHIAILNNILDAVLIKVMKLRNSKVINEIHFSQRLKALDLIIFNLSIYLDKIIPLNKFILYVFNVIPSTLRLKIIYLLIKLKSLIKR
jgi:hypothetical protein